MENPIQWPYWKQYLITGVIIILFIGIASYLLKIIMGIEVIFDMYPEFVTTTVPIAILSLAIIFILDIISGILIAE